ncbi:hypothetical protein F4054_18280 [Candidatus Poribacteria bacterium]|nr:hypothetical protein [Candidatus Poribacteria bacterium]MYG07721.1 hypothetical protein [Candidatus Poribacteria bacterium]MYK24191.1 hypothetical protein [Candidatus Poribacteria bacterium]
MQYDENRFEIWALPHPLILFYIVFPGAIVSELIFGQRLPKVMLIDKESDKPWMERTYIPCPQTHINIEYFVIIDRKAEDIPYGVPPVYAIGGMP